MRVVLRFNNINSEVTLQCIRNTFNTIDQHIRAASLFHSDFKKWHSSEIIAHSHFFREKDTIFWGFKM